MIDSSRILALAAGYAKFWQPNAAVDTHPENFAVLPFLLLDEWAENGYQMVQHGETWGAMRDVAASRSHRDELIKLGQPGGRL